MSAETTSAGKIEADHRPLVYRQKLATRITHWVWAISLFFLLLTGLQIFNAHPALYVGHQSGFGFDNAIFRIGAENTDNGPIGFAAIGGHKVVTTNWLGLFEVPGSSPTVRGFPAWATIPSYQDLATGRVIHFFFAWILVATLTVWLVSSLLNGHLWRDVIPRGGDWRNIPRDVGQHLRLRFHHVREYNTLQKLSYAAVLFILFPLIIATGLSMSPGFNALAPWLLDVFGGRQTARTIHFLTMLLIVGFVVVHVLMVVAAGPLNELRSIVTGWYRTDGPGHADKPEGE